MTDKAGSQAGMRIWPSALDSASVAKCYVCMTVVGKHHMICIGKNKNELDEPRNIWRCKTCEPGSQSWWDHFIPRYGHEEPFRSFALWYKGVKVSNRSETAKMKKAEEKARKQRAVKVTRSGGNGRNVSGVRKADPLREAKRTRAKANSSRNCTITRTRARRK